MRDAERNLASGVMNAGATSARREEEKEPAAAGPSARVSTAFVHPPSHTAPLHNRFGSGGGAPLSPHTQFGSLEHDLAAAGDALARARERTPPPPVAAATTYPTAGSAAFARVGGYPTTAGAPFLPVSNTAAPAPSHARTVSALSAFQAQSSLEDSVASVRALAEQGVQGLELLSSTMAAFKTKMRQAFDTNMLSLDAKVRLVRKDILGHISESNRELENRIVEHLRLNAVTQPTPSGGMGTEEAGNIEFRTATQEELLYLKGELAKSALTTQTIQAELERKTRGLATSLQSCTAASNHASAGLVDLQASLIHLEKENASLREDLEALKLRTRKEQAAQAATANAKQHELTRAVAELKHMVEQQVLASESRAAAEATREAELLAHINSAAQAYIDEQAAVTSASIASVRRSLANQGEDLERLRQASRGQTQTSRRGMLLSASAVASASASASQHGGLSFGASASPSVLAATGAEDELDDAAFFAKQLASATARVEALESAARSSKALLAEQGSQIDALRAQLLQADSAQRLSLSSAVRDWKAEQARAEAECGAREAHARKTREEMNDWARTVELSIQNLRYAQTSSNGPSAAEIIATPAPAAAAQVAQQQALLDESTAKLSKLESDVRSLSTIIGRAPSSRNAEDQPATHSQAPHSALDLSSQLLALEQQQTQLQTQHFQLVSRVETHAAESMAQLAHLQSLAGQQHKPLSAATATTEALLTTQQVSSIADASASRVCAALRSELREEIAALQRQDAALTQGLTAVQEAQRQTAQAVSKLQSLQDATGVARPNAVEKLVVPRTLTLAAATGSVHSAASSAGAAGSAAPSVERVPDSPNHTGPIAVQHQRARSSDQLAAICDEDDPVSEEKFDVPAASSSFPSAQWQASPLSDDTDDHSGPPRPSLPQTLPLKKPAASASAAAAGAGLPPRSPVAGHPPPIIRVGGPGYASTAAVSKPLLSAAAGTTAVPQLHARSAPTQLHPSAPVSPSVASNAAALVADSSSEEESSDDDDEASLVDPKQAAHQSLSPVNVPGAPVLRASMSPELPAAGGAGDRSTTAAVAAAREMRIPASVAAHVAQAPPQVSPSTAELAALSPTPVPTSATDPTAVTDDDSTNGVPHTLLAAQIKQRYLDAELAGQVDGEGRSIDEDSLYDHDHDQEHDTQTQQQQLQQQQQRPNVDVENESSPTEAVVSPSAAAGASGSRTPKLSAREQKFQALLARHQRLNSYNRNSTPPSASSASAAREALGEAHPEEQGAATATAAQTAANLAAAAPAVTSAAPAHRRKPLSSDEDSDFDLISSPTAGPSAHAHALDRDHERDLHDSSLLDRTEASDADASEHDLSLHSKFQQQRQQQAQAQASQGRLMSEQQQARPMGSYAAVHQALQQQSPPVGADWDSEVEEEAMLSASNAPDEDDEEEQSADHERHRRRGAPELAHSQAQTGGQEEEDEEGQDSTESGDDEDRSAIVAAAGSLKLLPSFGSSSLSGKAPLPSRHSSSHATGGISELSPLGSGSGSGAGAGATAKPKANLGVSRPGQPLHSQQQHQQPSGAPPTAGFLKQPLGAPQTSQQLPAFARAPLGSSAAASSSSSSAAPATSHSRAGPPSAALRSSASEFDDESDEESDDDLSALSNDGGRRSGSRSAASASASQQQHHHQYPKHAQTRLQPQQAPTFDSDDDLSTLVEHDDVLSPMQSQHKQQAQHSLATQQRQPLQHQPSSQYGVPRSRRLGAGHGHDDPEQDAAGVSELDSLDISASGNDFNTDF